MKKENFQIMYRIVLIGSVFSSEITLKKLIEHKLNVVGAMGVEKIDTSHISGYVNLRNTIKNTDIPFQGFEKINSQEVKDKLIGWKPDIIFVVGLSQIVNNDILKIPSKGVIGFHPTKLPKGRGRAPIAWLILNEHAGAANFFLMQNGIDDGPIFTSKPYNIDDSDDATTIEKKIEDSIKKSLDIWLPKLKAGEWKSVEQNQNEASYYARRAPQDGCIDWYESAYNIDRLIKATTKPYPGAYTFYGNNKIVIWKSRISKIKNIQGVVGRIVTIVNNIPVIQTGNGLLEIIQFQLFNYVGEEIITKNIVIGSRLGYYEQNEIFKLRNEIEILRSQIISIKK